MISFKLKAAALCALVAMPLWSSAAVKNVKVTQGVMVGDGIARFIPKGYDAEKIPTFAIADEPEEKGSLPENWQLVPDFYLENGKATGSLYWDNGEGWEYRNGEYSLQKYSARTEGDSVIVSLTGKEGSMETENKGMAIVKVITDNGIRQASGNLEEGITVKL